ncbi:MAG TPA: hypothetical protein VFG52_08070, partial [Xanthomonadales bacterium]|nr:hypothetical protein [Xanthomonadales bacterium]
WPELACCTASMDRARMALAKSRRLGILFLAVIADKDSVGLPVQCQSASGVPEKLNSTGDYIGKKFANSGRLTCAGARPTQVDGGFP